MELTKPIKSDEYICYLDKLPKHEYYRIGDERIRFVYAGEDGCVFIGHSRNGGIRNDYPEGTELFRED